MTHMIILFKDEWKIRYSTFFIYIEIYVDSVFQCYAKPSINYLTPLHEMSSPRTQINKYFKI